MHLLELCGGLFILVLVLGIVTVVGHGLWVLIASIFGAMSDAAPRRPPAELDRSAKPGDEPNAWQGAARALQRLHNHGLLPREQLANMLRTLRSEHDRVTGKRETEILPKQHTPAAVPEASPEKPAEQEPPAAKPPVIVRETPLDIQEFAEETPTASVEPPAVTVVTQRKSPKRQRDWGGLLQAFMEEKNIRWGELISGMLIVGSAIGLVISLWSTLKEAIPYFPALLFMLGTAAIHGAGLYTFKRWKLKSTSRGLLLISALLIPLNFTAAIALTGQPGQESYRPVTDPLYLIAVTIGLLTYGAISYSTGRVFRKRQWWVLWVGLMVPSIGQLVIARQAEGDLTTGFANLLCLLPLLGFTGALGAQLQLASRGKRFTQRRSERLFQTLGIALFSLALAIGLFVARSDGLLLILSQIAPSLSVVAVLVTAAGICVHQRVKRESLAAIRTAGTAISIGGSVMMLAVLALAWPQPDLLIAVGIVNLVALTALALVGRLPALHVPAIVSATFTALIAYHWADGTITAGVAATGNAVIEAVVMGRSSLILLLFASITLAAYFGWEHIKRYDDARSYFWGAISLGTMSLLVAFIAGFVIPVGDRAFTTPVFLVAAAALFIVCRMQKWPWAAFSGTAMTFVGLWHFFAWNEPVMEWLGERSLTPADPIILSSLLSSTVAVILALVLRNHSGETEQNGGRSVLTSNVVRPLCMAACCAASIWLVMVPAVRLEEIGNYSGYLFWVAGLWGTAAWSMRSRGMLSAAQGVSFLAVWFAGTAFARYRGWWDDNFADPLYWQWHAAISVLWCIGWTAVRLFVSPDSRPAGLLGRRKWNVDHVVLAGCVAVSVVFAIIGVLPGIAAEFQVTGSENIAAALLQRGGLDRLVFLLIVGLALATLAGVSSLFKPEWLGILFVAGFLFVAIVAVGSTNVTAESYRAWSGLAHKSALDWPMYVLVGLLAIAVILQLRERVSVPFIVTLVVLGAVVTTLIAAEFEEARATATALRWGLALFGMVITGAILSGSRLRTSLQRLGFEWTEAQEPDLSHAVKAIGLGLTVWPVLGLTLLAAFQLSDARLFNGPDLEFFFGVVGTGVLYAVPLWGFAAAMLWQAFARRDERHAITASILIQLGMTVLLAMPHWEWAGAFDGVGLIQLLQWNALGLGVCTLLWTAGRHFIHDADRDPADAEPSVSPLMLQLVWTLAVAGVLSAWAAVAIFVNPEAFADVIQEFGSLRGILALLLAGGALMLPQLKLRSTAAIDIPVLLIVILMPTLAARLSWLNLNDDWLSYHALMVGWGGLLIGLAATYLLREPLGEDAADSRGRRIILWATLLSGLVVLLGIRGQWADPMRPWWLVGASTAAAISMIVIAMRRRSEPLAYVSVGLVLLGTMAALSQPWIFEGPMPTLAAYLNVVQVELIALAGIGLFWLSINLYWQRQRGEEFSRHPELLPVHHTVAAFGLIVLGVLAFWTLSAREVGRDVLVNELVLLISPVGTMGLILTAGLLIGLLWDRRAKLALPGIFVLSVIAAVAALDGMNAGGVSERLQLGGDHLWFGLGMIATGVSFLSAVLWRFRGPLASVRDRLLIARETTDAQFTGEWLPKTNAVLAGIALVIHFWSVLWFDDPGLRLASGIATLFLAVTLGAFADTRYSSQFRFAAVLLVLLSAVQLAWALPIHEGAHVGLERAIRLLEVTAVATLLFAVALARVFRRDEAWGKAVRQVSVVSSVGAIFTLLVVLGIEAELFVSKVSVPISNAQVGVVAGILVALSAGLILFAVLPERDPLQLSERGRMAYVYASELVMSLLFLHIYLTKPEWFHGFLLPYWPYIVIAIAYVGIGVGEVSARLKLRVLSEPLQRTAAFLPLLPMLAFWVTATRPGFDRYSLHLFLAGLAYVMLAISRKSFVYALTAGLVGNLALWALLYHADTTIWTRPQLWLIPPALSALVAAQLNRKRLTESQLTAIRYFSVIVIYVSSTGEMFIRGAGRPGNWWHPMVLAALSVAGVLAGIWMRIRAYLYLGTSFLFLSIVSMVWHAARSIEHVWPWWVFGILLGLAVLTLFGLFEKKRNEVLQVLKGMREWER